VITARKFDSSAVRISATSSYYPRKSLQQELIRDADSFFALLKANSGAGTSNLGSTKND
jgi:hypothetical protein